MRELLTLAEHWYILLTNHKTQRGHGQMEKTSTGLDENVAGLLCYVLGWISGIVFLLIEPENKFVRFHAIQSIIVFGVISIASAILTWPPFIGIVFSWLIGVVAFILWVVLMVKAYQGTRYKIPWAGNLAEKLMGGQKE